MKIDKYNLKLMPPMFGEWKPDAGKQPIAMLMSGGVDSSVSAHLLKSAGWDVVGITMQIPVSCGAGTKGCCGAEAALVAKELGISHYYMDVLDAFEKLIIEPFRKSYSDGETPNPCIDCNSLLKFSLLWDFIEEQFGITHVATGHYARVVKEGDETFLRRAMNQSKDQSYFLCGITPERLKDLVLPLGEYSKEQIREMARDLDLSVAEKSESMELCFAGEGDYRAVLDVELADKEGDMLDMEGNKIGVHKGIANYTIGQRRGLKFAGGEPLYVGKINPADNTVALGTRDQVCRKQILADRVNILVDGEYKAGSELFGKIRSGGYPKPCRLTSACKDEMVVEFDELQFGPCPGQRLVLYDKSDNIVAGGIILRSDI
jgi:tRNA-uridine 2-sulfurtransferase